MGVTVRCPQLRGQVVVRDNIGFSFTPLILQSSAETFRKPICYRVVVSHGVETCTISR